jgi:hypothetical protein
MPGVFLLIIGRLITVTESVGASRPGRVLATTGGTPTGSPLYQSGDTAIPAILTELTFAPNIPLTVGDLYFAGFDTGLRTASPETSP